MLCILADTSICLLLFLLIAAYYFMVWVYLSLFIQFFGIRIVAENTLNTEQFLVFCFVLVFCTCVFL